MDKIRIQAHIEALKFLKEVKEKGRYIDKEIAITADIDSYNKQIVDLEKQITTIDTK